MLERFTISTFAEHLHETFRVYPDAADSGRFLEVALIEATDLSTRGGPRTTEASTRRAPFSIVLRGPATPILPQRIYRLEHPALGNFDLFLVPIGPDQGGMRYEAIFT
jgi:hypothetical protein